MTNANFLQISLGMGIQKDIEKLFKRVLEQHNNNKAAAALSLGINPVTFWGWVEGKRKKKEVLFDAIDRAGGVLHIYGEPLVKNQESQLQRLQEKIDGLQRENELLQKLLKKYEGDEAKQSQEQAKVANKDDLLRKTG